ncbi:Cytochrome c oxidase assembly protein cox18, mitochondrial [Allomyces javanicus]|nr:Cytochrome c oxidase assembly protein cox18, mitochondrial [Allomyces javanicus]
MPPPEPASAPALALEPEPAPHLSANPDYARRLASHADPSPPAEPFGLAPVDLAGLALDAAHRTLGGGWGAAIIATTVLLRSALTLPLALYQHQTALKMVQLRPLLRAWERAIAHQVRAESRQANLSYEQFAAQYKCQYARKIGELYHDHGVRPLFTALAPLAQAPLWITMSLTLRRMAAVPGTEPVSALVRDYGPAPLVGADASPLLDLIVPHLAATDATWITACAFGAIQLANVELAALSLLNPAPSAPPASKLATPVEPSATTATPATDATDAGATPTAPAAPAAGWTRHAVIKHMMRATAVLMVPIAHAMPAGVVLYWLTSAAFSVAQNVVFKIWLPRRYLQSQEALEQTNVAADEDGVASATEGQRDDADPRRNKDSV